MKVLPQHKFATNIYSFLIDYNAHSRIGCSCAHWQFKELIHSSVFPFELKVCFILQIFTGLVFLFVFCKKAVFSSRKSYVS